MSSVKKLAMIIVMQNDLQAGVDFYKKMGLKLVFHVPGKWAELAINGFQIGLCPTQEKISYNRTGIVFEVADLPAFYEAHKEVMNFLDKPVQATHGIMASLQDPAGNIIDLYQPTPENVQKMAAMGEQDSCCKTDSNSASCC